MRSRKRREGEAPRGYHSASRGGAGGRERSRAQRRDGHASSPPQGLWVLAGRPEGLHLARNQLGSRGGEAWRTNRCTMVRRVISIPGSSK